MDEHEFIEIVNDLLAAGEVSTTQAQSAVNIMAENAVPDFIRKYKTRVIDYADGTLEVHETANGGRMAKYFAPMPPSKKEESTVEQMWRVLKSPHRETYDSYLQAQNWLRRHNVITLSIVGTNVRSCYYAEHLVVHHIDEATGDYQANRPTFNGIRER